MDILKDLLVLAAKESECVALFVITVIVIVVMHVQNSKRLDMLREQLRAHVDDCQKKGR